MKQNYRTSNPMWIVLTLILVCLCGLTISCSEERNTFEIPEVISDPTITELDKLIAQINVLKETSSFGLEKGMYPTDSKTLLDMAISSANRYVLLIKANNPSPSSEEKARYIAEVTASITQFEATKRTEDAPSEPAFLFVNGLQGGYIDFGYDTDYFTFGSVGEQAFTVEFWVKITAYGKEDNSMMLSTFVDNGSAQPRYRRGWMLYSRNQNVFRTTLGVFDNNGQDYYQLWEPSYSYSGTDEWVHYAFVYNDKGLDGNANLRGKLYKNGVKAEELNIGENYRTYNAKVTDGLQIPMTAFGRFNSEQKWIEGFSGYMRRIRIWKVAKDNTYIQQAKTGSAQIDPADPDLVSAWDFEQVAYHDDQILDLTGRHKAKLVGTYTWENR